MLLCFEGGRKYTHTGHPPPDFSKNVSHRQTPQTQPYRNIWNLSEKKEAATIFTHPFPFLPEDSCLPPAGRQDYFLNGYFLEAELNKRSSAKPHRLYPCPSFMDCHLDLPQPRTFFCVDKQKSIKSWKPKRWTSGAGQYVAHGNSDHFVLLCFSLIIESTDLSQNVHQREYILWMQTLCTMLLQSFQWVRLYRKLNALPSSNFWISKIAEVFEIIWALKIL